MLFDMFMACMDTTDYSEPAVPGSEKCLPAVRELGFLFSRTNLGLSFDCTANTVHTNKDGPNRTVWGVFSRRQYLCWPLWPTKLFSLSVLRLFFPDIIWPQTPKIIRNCFEIELRGKLKFRQILGNNLYVTHTRDISSLCWLVMYLTTQGL